MTMEKQSYLKCIDKHKKDEHEHSDNTRTKRTTSPLRSVGRHGGYVLANDTMPLQ